MYAVRRIHSERPLTRSTVVVAGLGALAIELAKLFLEERQLVGVVAAQAPPPGRPLLEDWAVGHGVPVFAHHEEVPPVDLALLCGYRPIVGKPFITRHRRVLNLHSGPLPEMRGLHTIEWALKLGHTEHGLTLHEVTEGIDEGPILAIVRYPIWPDREGADAVRERFEHLAVALIRSLLPVLGTLPATEQDHGGARYFSRADGALLGLDRDR